MDPARRTTLRGLAGAAALALVKPSPVFAGTLATRTIPSSGEALPAIGIGTWQTFDVAADAAAHADLKEVMTLFSAAGGRVIDSSPMYGSSEAVAGEIAASLGITARLFVATKVWTRGREEGIAQMEASSAKLRVRKIDLMQVHNLVDVAVHTKTLEDWKAGGRIRYLGITHYTRSAYVEVERLLRTGKYDFVQVNYSLAEPDSQVRLLPLARDKGVAVLVNRPFAEGEMFRRTRGKPLPPWAAEFGAASWAQFFLKWIVSHPAVTCAIPGTGKPSHMQDNLGAGIGPMPDAEMRRRMAAHYASL